VACSLGMEGLRKLAQAVEAHGQVFTPHTWGNGIGLAANLHLTAGAASAPFIEFPYDPPEWSIERRDFMLTQPIDVDDEGWLTLRRTRPRPHARRGRARGDSKLSQYLRLTDD
jgi:L-alanine-DL-glutamate epimerase-like enolase superfamily enzyme